MKILIILKQFLNWKIPFKSERYEHRLEYGFNKARGEKIAPIFKGDKI